MTRPFFLYFILKAFGLTLLPSYMISIFKSVISSGGTFLRAFSHSRSISRYCFKFTSFACETRLSSSGEPPNTSAIRCPAWSLSSFPGVFGLCFTPFLANSSNKLVSNPFFITLWEVFGILISLQLESEISVFFVLLLVVFSFVLLFFPDTLSSNSSICFFTKSTALFKFSFALERIPFILFPYCEFYFG